LRSARQGFVTSASAQGGGICVDTRSVRALTLALAALTTTAVVAPASTAHAVTCKPPTTLLSRTPVVKQLPGGAVMRTWDTGPTSDPMKSQRIVAVKVPRSSALRGYVAWGGALTRTATVATYASRVAGAVVTVNGSVFDPSTGVPVASVMRYGTALKGANIRQYVVALGTDRKARMDSVILSGSARARGYTWSTTGLNWNSVTGSGINVYTTAWGSARRPYGTVDVVVSGGKVVARRTGTSRGDYPRSGQVVLTATGTTGTQLSALRVGDAVSLSYRLRSWSGATIVDAITRGHRYVDGSYTDGGSCSERDEQLRPRTAIAWTAAGDLMVVTVSGRAVVNGVMYGGATHHQMPTYLRQLGADKAVGLDGGGSTTMYVRSTVSGSPYRVDRPSNALRGVPTALGWK
jgi:hypothetical protein